MLVFRPETRQDKNTGSGFDSIETGKTLGAVVLAVLVLKVYAEQGLGLASWMESIADYPIVSVVHAYGVAAGLIFELARGCKLTRGTAFTIWRRRRID